MTEPITLRQWNRTLLQRQHLLTRVDDDAIEVLDRCVGLQSQDPRAAFFGLWSRIEDFDPLELDELLTDREVVRIALLRSTIFLIDAEDARWIRPLAEPILQRELTEAHLPRLTGADPHQIVADAAELLAGRELSGSDLGKELVTRHPEENPSTLTGIARCGLPLVQVPPRGLWRGRGEPTYRLFDEWVGPGEPAVDGDDARADLIRLYLRGFGPATAKAIHTWSGLTGLRPLLDKLEADWELVRLTGPHGEVLYDLDGIGLADPDTPAPARLVAPFDHVIGAQADRIRVADPELFRRTVTPNGRSPGFVLVDGFLAGTWHLDADDAVDVRYLSKVTAAQRRDVDVEVDRLRELLDGA
ncbi:winged helix DNA-binding domain-containing protein [Gordonia jinghuaiqii]|uniref:Winged helix DNA-binding domain-containing protein n=1 Tax=Gordonia jinghuaiqii TaxID=2758710 RepID=A0A7D7RB19_9ACTN|nr:winged helix DNA-binding domain-containing protein [Gordonia jinghuaiqii]MCR5978887.1 winged helix DNA-binding domain-containing protein [Gordonia jinghuaiqii]QMT01770.1 winged helix DNA-binding domain-containing protein [Gordonia jinghuaiqii]